jgi:hypothetical protein
MRAIASGFAFLALFLGGVGAHFAGPEPGTSPPSAPEISTAGLPTPAIPSDSTAAASASGRAELLEVRKIWDQGGHNAFTDLLRHNDQWICVFREAKAHVAPDGAIRVLISQDGSEWKSAARISRQESDLRDPKLTCAADGRLMLSAAAVRQGKYRTVAWYSDDGRNWGESAEIGEPNMWLWRVTWRGPQAFGVGYGTAESHLVRLYRSQDGKQFEPLVNDLFHDEYPNEASLLFLPDESALCLLRRDAGNNTAQFGLALPPYDNWKWKDLGRRIAAPDVLLLDDGRILAAGRSYTGAVRTSLLWLDPAAGQLTEILKLPSGGDTGCPGLVLYDGVLWVSYYASHEGKTSIYLAKVKLPAAG